MKKNNAQEAQGSTNALVVKLILVGVMAIFLFGNVLAAGGVGGTITKDGKYYVHTFTSNGTFNWSGDTTNISFLIIGGGGAGGQDTIGAAGGGGAGGYVYNTSAEIIAGAYAVNIGLGGNSSGANSSFNFTTLQAAGGGIGAYYIFTVNYAGNGSSGGGSAQNGHDVAKGFGIPSQGSNGGGGTFDGANGGGGAGQVGQNSTSNPNGGAGGMGLYNSINGTNFTWSCGGGGAGNSGGTNGSGGCSSAAAGKGGGGQNNTGAGGGGGGEGFSNGAGGSGIVIIRYINLTALEVHLVSPANNTNTSDQTNYFVSDVINSTVGVTNVSLYINGTLNQTNTSQMNGTYNFSVPLSAGRWNWTIVAYGNNSIQYNATNGTFILNVAKLVFGNQAFDAQAIEQSSTTLRVNFSLGSAYGVSSVNLTYNQTNYSASFAAVNSTYYQATVTLSTPQVSTSTNMTFNWTAFLTDSTSSTSSNNLQLVLNFGIDACVSNTIQIMNLSLVDEDSQVSLNGTIDNTSIKVNLNLYPNGSLTVPTFQFSKFYNQTLPARVCINSSLGNSTFFMNTQIEYGASNYATEFYNIKNYSLNATNNPSENITLYDLLSSRNQVFLVTYRDSNFLPVADALIQVGRLYVDEGITKTIEIPITDTNGQSVANLVLNSVVYTFTVTKNGQVLAIFSNQLAKCQNPAITTCSIELNSFSSSIAVTNFTEATDFMYTLTYDRSTRVVSTTFTIPSGAVSTVLLNVTGADAISTFLCSQNVTTSSGTLTCTIPTSFGNQTAYATLYKDGVVIAFGSINNNQDPADIYSGILVFMGIIIMITLIGAAVSDNPVYTGVFLIVGFGLLVSLNLVANTGLIGGFATILWLVVGIIIIAVKGGGRT